MVCGKRNAAGPSMAQRDSEKEILPGRSQASLHGKARGRGESQGRCAGKQRAKQQPVFLKIVLDIFKKPRYYEVVFQTIP